MLGIRRGPLRNGGFDEHLGIILLGRLVVQLEGNSAPIRSRMRYVLDLNREGEVY